MPAITATAEELQALLGVQDHDTALDRLVRRHADLPQRPSLSAAQSRAAQLATEMAGRQAELAELVNREKQLELEAGSAEEHADTVEKTLYSGTVTSPRELQALQADLDQLRRQQREIEDRELEIMEARETLEGEIARLEAGQSELAGEIAQLEADLAAAEFEIDAEADAERAARAGLAGQVNAALLADYEARRTRNRGIGIARLVGTRCQGCGLTLPSVEVDAFRHAPAGAICLPEDCECILVPS